MDPITGAAIISAGASLGGSLFSGGQSAKQASANRKHQLYMSNTAHQRQVADLKAAGLNPILAAGGSGAPMGPGATAAVPDYGRSIAGGVSAATQLASVKASTALTKQQVKQSAVDAEHQAAAYKWLDQNPRFKQMLYASKLAKDNGLPPSIFGPLLTTNSAGTQGWVAKMVDKVWGDPATKAHNALMNWQNKRNIRKEIRKRNKAKSDKEKAWRKDLEDIQGNIYQDDFGNIQVNPNIWK